MNLFDVSIPALLVLSISTIAAVWVDVFVWRREDPVLFKLAVTLLSLVPVLGPIAGLWITSFPDKMHPDLQAKYKNTLNAYKVPKDFIQRQAGEGAGDNKR